MIKYILTLLISLSFTLSATTIERIDLPMGVKPPDLVVNTPTIGDDHYVHFTVTGVDTRGFVGSKLGDNGYLVNYTDGEIVYITTGSIEANPTIDLVGGLEITGTFTINLTRIYGPYSDTSFSDGPITFIESVDTLKLSNETLSVTATPDGEQLSVPLETTFNLSIDSDYYLRGKPSYDVVINGLNDGESLVIDDKPYVNGEHSIPLYRVGDIKTSVIGSQAPYDDREITLSVSYRGELLGSVVLFNINRLESVVVSPVTTKQTWHKFINSDDANKPLYVNGEYIADIPANGELLLEPSEGTSAYFTIESYSEHIKAFSFVVDMGTVMDLTQLDVEDK